MLSRIIRKLGLNPDTIKSVSSIATGNVLAQAFRFLFWFVVIWIVSKEEYGYLKYSLTVATFLSIPAVSGFSAAITKFMAENLDNREKMEKIAFQTIIIDATILAALIVTSLLTCTILPDKIPMISVYLLSILGVYSMYYAFSRGLMDVRRIISFTVTVNLFRTLIVFFLYAIGFRGIQWALFAYGLPLLIGLMFSVALGTDRARPHISRIDTKFMKRISIFAIPGLISAGMWIFVGQIDIIFITNYFGYEKTASYSLAKTFSSVIAFVTSAIIVLQMPKISSFKGDLERIYRYTMRSLKLAIIVVVPMAILLYVFSSTIIRIFPEDYTESLGFLYIIIPGTIFSGLFALLGATWTGYGKPEEEAKVLAMGVASILLLNFILIPVIGIWAIPTSFLITEAFIFIIMFIKTERYFGTKRHI